jgi:hypothetical protein
MIANIESAWERARAGSYAHRGFRARLIGSALGCDLAAFT